MLVEIAPEQLDPVTTMAGNILTNAHVSFSKDLLGVPRIIIIDLEMGTGQEHESDNSSVARVIETGDILVNTS
jgi:hypothetical protein